MPLFEIDNWRIESGQSWAIIGHNGSGKGNLSRHLAAIPSSTVSVLSFESQQAFFEEQLRNDDSEYMDRLDTGPTVQEILTEAGASPETIEGWAQRFRIKALLDRGYRLLSSGEGRKTLLLRAIARHPDLLILDEPFEGLDQEAYQEISTFCQDVQTEGQTLLLLVNRLDDIQAWNTHIGVLRNGSIVAAGSKTEMEASSEMKQLFQFNQSSFPELPDRLETAPEQFSQQTIFSLTDARVDYDEQPLFQNLTWKLERGQHSLITGPNGCGKSTLLQLIAGDHPQCYSNDLNIFGYQRGSGESIWDIKRNIGLVSSNLHRDHRVVGDAATIIVSGLHDTIGLYTPASANERKAALDYLERVGLREKATTPFRFLSYGEQRLVLIARALIKKPTLLILDEPTQGLDDINRHLVLSFIEQLGRQTNTTLLFVSHRKDEWLSTFTHRLDFVPTPEGPAGHRIQEKPILG